MEKLELEKNWDKVFSKSNQVNHRKITLHNRYGITLVADLYEPKEQKDKLYFLSNYCYELLL